MQPMYDTIAHLYAGEIMPRQAFDFLGNNPDARLVDVRTMPEWSFVGYPDIGVFRQELIRLSWRFYPTMQRNTAFEEQLEAIVPDKAAPLLFICRTGGRSLDAAIAMAARGYRACYNVTGGFEGEVDVHCHRGYVNGWKAEQLPWRQE